MKIQFTFKSPDVVSETLKCLESDGIELDVSETTLYNDLKKWFEWNEYVTVEYDTITKNMIVVDV